MRVYTQAAHSAVPLRRALRSSRSTPSQERANSPKQRINPFTLRCRCWHTSLAPPSSRDLRTLDYIYPTIEAALVPQLRHPGIVDVWHRFQTLARHRQLFLEGTGLASRRAMANIRSAHVMNTSTERSHVPPTPASADPQEGDGLAVTSDGNEPVASDAHGTNEVPNHVHSVPAPLRARGGPPSATGGRPAGKPGGQKKPQLTHFLCIPLVNSSSREQLQRSLGMFKSEVTVKAGSEGAEQVPVKAIRPLGTLHLTLGVMSLPTEEKLERATRLLEDLDLRTLLLQSQSSSSTDGPSTIAHSDNSTPPASNMQVNDADIDSVSDRMNHFKVDLRSIEAMRNPRKTTVLYISPVASSPSFPLWSFGNALRDIFTDARLMQHEERPLKLHATVVNTIYAGKAGGKGRGRGGGKPLEIDAAALIERYKDFDWARDVKIDKVAICRMGAKKIFDEQGEVIEEQYEAVAEKTMPM